ncbi:tetratricopeptide repeat protein, partial [Lysobacter sp. ISL-52]
DRAQALADNGRFTEAATACEAYLQTHSASARALYLSGLIHGALGRDSAAEDHFRKVLYLEPCHEEALMHLALLLETRGDAAGARVLRLRAQRCRSAAAGRQESQ